MMSRHKNLTGPSIQSNRADRRVLAPLFKFDGVYGLPLFRFVKFLGY